ncbi:SusE domain-containing protein [Lacibacter sp.]|uniref:SusE domain-containing protein n=1 Tax=Lacibacter sp. TaxID=1915409 RepID=UPI002B4B5C3B|nr:SusE domain-containing protein [Lacibacter sp.]HLP36206.1 SusE domain-containing protein [Lacibacter sp.]
MKIVYQILSMLALVTFAACEKVENKVVLQGSTKPDLTASTTTVRLEPGEENNTALRLSWTNPDYEFTTGISSHDVKYKLEIDTLGGNFNSTNRYINVFSKELDKTYTVGELNNILGNTMLLQLDPRRSYTFQARITASLGTNSDIRPVVSDTVTFTARPFPPPPKVTLPFNNELFIVGGATPGGWNNPVPEPAQKFTRLSSTKYEITIDLTADYYLLLPQNGSWSNKYSVKDKNLAGLGNGGDFGYNLSDDIPAPSVPGKYKITVDFQIGKFTAVKQ